MNSLRGVIWTIPEYAGWSKIRRVISDDYLYNVIDHLGV
jgi:hypothetical protein